MPWPLVKTSLVLSLFDSTHLKEHGQIHHLPPLVIFTRGMVEQGVVVGCLSRKSCSGQSWQFGEHVPLTVTPSLPQTVHITLSLSFYRDAQRSFALLACYALTFSQDISCVESFWLNTSEGAWTDPSPSPPCDLHKRDGGARGGGGMLEPEELLRSVMTIRGTCSTHRHSFPAADCAHHSLSFYRDAQRSFALLACYALTFSQDISCVESFWLNTSEGAWTDPSPSPPLDDGLPCPTMDLPTL